MSSCLKRIAAFALAGVMLLMTGCATDIVDDYEISEALLGSVEVEQLSSNRFTQLEPEGTKKLYTAERVRLVSTPLCSQKRRSSMAT